MGLIRVLGIALIIYLIFRLVTRFLLPLAARYFVKKATENMQERMRSQHDGQKVYQDEKVTIRKTENTKNGQSTGSDDGEYIDYEEV